MNNIPGKASILAGMTLLLFFCVALAVSNSQHGAASGQSLNVPAISASAPAMSNQTVVPDQLSQLDPHVFETMISLPSQPAQGRQAITGPVDDISIRSFIAANVPVAGIAAHNVQVVTIEYLSVQGLKNVLPNSDPFWDGFPPNEPVAYVVLSGDFVAQTDPGARGSGATTTYHTAHRVFSVRTGNELGGQVGPMATGVPVR